MRHCRRHVIMSWHVRQNAVYVRTSSAFCGVPRLTPRSLCVSLPTPHSLYTCACATHNTTPPHTQPRTPARPSHPFPGHCRDPAPSRGRFGRRTHHRGRPGLDIRDVARAVSVLGGDPGGAFIEVEGGSGTHHDQTSACTEKQPPPPSPPSPSFPHSLRSQ